MFGNVKKSEFNFTIRDIAREINKVEKRLREIEQRCQKCKHCKQCEFSTNEKSDG